MYCLYTLLVMSCWLIPAYCCALALQLASVEDWFDLANIKCIIGFILLATSIILPAIIILPI